MLNHVMSCTYYSTIMSFYHIRSREGAKYEAVTQWKPRSTDTRLIRTPAYNGQLCLSRKKSYIFSLKLTRLMRTLVIRTTDTFLCPVSQTLLFLGGIFCLEYPSRRSEKGSAYFANYRFSFCKLQILISQTTDCHFANYRFSFLKLQIIISQSTDFHFANYSSHFTNYRFSFRKLQIPISFRSISFRKPLQ